MNKNSLTSFYRYNIVSLTATAVDFIMLIFLTEVLQFWYVLSAFLGAFMGGATGFALGRNWVFMRKDGKLSSQAIKYLMVWIVSIFLNTSGLYLIVEYFGIQYIISKIIVAIVVGVGFNFFMHKNFTFK
ncbi:MAG: GtrA family protein [Bacteroidales bacterium]|jgi:putative flippase GtrA|nr:GtrA family protein [Bacteroidales bacterium]